MTHPDNGRLTVISTDTHIGPRLVEELQPYCPSKRKREYEDYVNEHRAWKEAFAAANPSAFVIVDGVAERNTVNRKTAGHWSMAARRADMDRDGVAAEVIFHGSQNDQPIPFAHLGSINATATPAGGVVSQEGRVMRRRRTAPQVFAGRRHKRRHQSDEGTRIDRHVWSKMAVRPSRGAAGK